MRSNSSKSVFKVVGNSTVAFLSGFLLISKTQVTLVQLLPVFLSAQIVHWAKALLGWISRKLNVVSSSKPVWLAGSQK